MSSLVGQSIGQYELRRLIGMGGMGAVYLAYQPSLDREVAIKIMSPKEGHEDLYQRRFDVEARTAAALEHSHIVPVYDYGTQGPYSYIVMRLLTGGSLEQKTGPGKIPLTLDEVVRIIGDIASALHYAHEKGIVHRDIKPSNVMFDDRGTLFMVDFGIAKLANATTGLTETNQNIGTPRYMAPEQWRGDKIGPPADQYALAILTYQLLTGQVLFKADASHEYMHRHLYDMPPLTENWQANLPEAIIPVLARALRKHPENRYPDIEAFAAALKDAVTGKNDAASLLPSDSDIGHPPTPSDTLILSEQPVPKVPANTSPLNQWGRPAAGVLVIFGLALGLMWLSGQGATSGGTPTPVGGGGAGADPGTGTAPAAIIEETEEATPTLTLTFTATATETEEPSPTASDTPTPTATVTPTATSTQTAAPTATATRTSPPTATFTPGPTLTEPVTAGESPCGTADVNDSGEVDIFDLRAIAAVFGSTQGDAMYDPEYDFDNNDTINILDLRRVSSQYGATCGE